ncbi:MAG: hypothetical protein V1720_09370 [bacterium]
MEFIDEEYLYSIINDDEITNYQFQKECIEKTKLSKGLTINESASKN